MKLKRRIGLPLVLGSLLALFALADVGMAVPYPTPVGGTPFRVPIVPAFKACPNTAVPTPNSTHGPPLNFPSCNPPQQNSTTVTVGPQALGFARIVVCPGNTSQAALSFCAPGCPSACSLPVPDVRLTGSGRDVQCRQTGVPAGCTIGGDYNPNSDVGGPYTTAGAGSTGANPACLPGAANCAVGADITATAALASPSTTSGGTGQFLGHAIRVTDMYNCNLTGSPTCPATSTSQYPATMEDLQFPVPVVCLADGTVAGSTCGTNTTANALVPGSVIAGQSAVVEIGEVVLNDSGPDGNYNTTNDNQVFAAQGIFLP